MSLERRYRNRISTPECPSYIEGVFKKSDFLEFCTGSLAIVGHRNFVISLLPVIYLRPEEGETNGGVLVGGDRQIDKLNSQGRCR